MKRVLFILALLCPVAFSQQGPLQGTSTLGGISATTQGAQSSNKLMGVIPAAKISIYLTGTTTLATGLTTDGTHSLSNPFYSNASSASNPGGYIAFASTSKGYDVVASSGKGEPNCTTAPLCYTSPVTLCKDCFPSNASGSGVDFTAAGDLSGTSSSQTVVGIQGHSIAAPTTAGYAHWNGSSWEYANPSGSGNTTSTSLTTNHLSKSNGPNSIVDSSITDDGSTVTVPENFGAKISTIGPLYDAGKYGAVGNTSTDDIVALQNTVNACTNYDPVAGVLGTGAGNVILPGGLSKIYSISSTLYMYDGCSLIAYAGQGNGPVKLRWIGPAVGVVVPTTGFTTVTQASLNPNFVFTKGFPNTSGTPKNRAAQFVTTFTGTNTLQPNDWVEISGCTTTAGLTLNRAVGQVASSTGSVVTVAIPEYTLTGTNTDTCTLTTISVMVAFDGGSRYTSTIENINAVNGTGTANIDWFFGSRVDTGTLIYGARGSGPSEYSFYFSAGGINAHFDGEWRSDEAGVAAIYFRVGGVDNLALYNGTAPNGASHGGGIILDNSACIYGTNTVNMNMTHVNFEQNSTPASGLASTVLYTCPISSVAQQFLLSYDNSAGYSPSILMSPPNDKALSLTVVNSSLPGFVGIPALSRYNMTGTAGLIPFLSYSPSLTSSGVTPTTDKAAMQLLGDVNIEQLYQYKTPATDWLFSDTSFAALPNGTTLYSGQTLAPPQYWVGTSGNRRAIDTVHLPGTTGTLNSGATTCTGSAGNANLICSSATDLSSGQYVSIGTDISQEINYIDASNPSAVKVVLVHVLYSDYASPTTLSFAAPTLGPEIQMPTKCSAAPTTGTWAQGDVCWNSAATSGGTCYWENVAAGTPGTWTAVACSGGGGGVTSINSQTGPAVTIQSSGSTVVVTRPSTNVINLEAAGGFHPLLGITVNHGGDSRGIVSSSCQVGALSEDTITGTVTGHIGTFTEENTNTQSVNNVLVFSQFTGTYTALNGYVGTVASVPGTNQFTVDLTSSGVPDGSTGTGYESCKYALPQQMRDDPAFAGATIVQSAAANQTASNTATNFDTLYPPVTLGTTILSAQLGAQDCLNSSSISDIESNMLTVMQKAHTNGYLYGAESVVPIPVSVFHSNSDVCAKSISSWIQTQGKSAQNSNPAICSTNGTGSTSTCGQYWDYISDPLELIPDYGESAFLCQVGPTCEPLHLTDVGVRRFESTVANGLVYRTIAQSLPITSSIISNNRTVIGTYLTDDTGTNPAYGLSLRTPQYYSQADGWAGFGSQDLAHVTSVKEVDCKSTSEVNLNEPFHDVTACIGLDPNYVNTYIVSATPDDAVAGNATGSLHLKDLVLDGTLKTSWVPPNMGMQVGNNTFVGDNSFIGNNNTIGNSTFVASTVSTPAVVISGSYSVTSPVIVQQTNLNSITVTTGNTIVFVNSCPWRASDRYPPTLTDSLGNTFSITSYPFTLKDGYAYIAIASNVIGGLDSFSGNCTNQLPQQVTEFSSVPTTSVLDGAISFKEYSGGGTYTTPLVSVSHAGSSVVSVIAGNTYSTASAPFTTSAFSSAGVLAYYNTPSIGAYAPIWTTSGNSGGIITFALRGIPSGGQTSDVQVFKDGLSGAVQAGVTAQGLPYVKPTTVAGYLALPCSTSANFGVTGAVLDALAPVVGSTPVSGGSAFAGVGCNGTGWVVTWK